MHLHVAIGWNQTGPTWRQFTAWQEWLDMQWNVPSRSDHYLMQCAAESRRAVVKNPNSVRAEKLKLQFKSKKRVVSQPQLSVEARTAIWMARCIQMSPLPIANLPDKYKVGYVPPPNGEQHHDEQRNRGQYEKPEVPASPWDAPT